MQNEAQQWSTRAVDRRQAINYWNELITDKVIGLDISSDHPAGFGGSLSGISVDKQQAYLISAEHNQHAWHHASSYSARNVQQIYILVHMRAGEFVLRTSSKQTKLKKGDAVLLSGTEAFNFCCPENTSSLVLRFEQEWLKKWLPHADDCVGQAINGAHAWGSTLSSALWNIDPDAIADSGDSSQEMLLQVAGLLSLASAPRSRITRNDAVYHRMVECLKHRFHDPHLTPTSLAIEIGISKRYLHQLFASSGTTFSRQLLQIRLERARALLQNPRNGKMSISQIAYHCGFNDPGYFARVFRKYQHVSPSEYRRLA